MKKRIARLISYLSIFSLLMAMMPTVAMAAETDEEVFPDGCVAEMDDLNAGGDTEEFPDESETAEYEEDDLNNSGDIQIPTSNAETTVNNGDEDLGSGEEIFPDNANSPAGEGDDLATGTVDDPKIAFSGISDTPESDDDLGASTKQVSIIQGSARRLVISCSYSGGMYMQYGTTNKSAYSCQWDKKWISGNSIGLTITGKKCGSGVVTIYAKKTSSGAVIATGKIYVTVTSPAKLSLSSSSVSVNSGASKTVKVSYSNYRKPVYMQYGTTNSSAYTCKWGSWSGSTVPITITGKSKGSGKVQVYLKDAATNATLATTSFRVSVTSNAKVTASKSLISLQSGSNSSVIFTVSGVTGTVRLQYSTTNARAYTCKWDSWSGNRVPLSITGKNAGSGKVKVYLKRPSGEVLDTVTVSVNVTAAAKPSIKVGRSSVTMVPGNSVSVPVTYSNVNGSIYYKYGTTNATAYTCRWGSWSNATNPLTITGKARGNGTVTVYLMRASDNTVLASAKITVSVQGSGISSLKDLSYKFGNFSGAASLNLCQYMFGNQAIARSVYANKIGSGGNCFGMATTAGLFHVPGNGVNTSSFGKGKSQISQLELSDRNGSWGLTTKQFVQAMQVSQASPKLKRTFVSVGQLGTLIANVNRQSFLGKPTIISIYGIHNGNIAGHAVIAYGVEKVSNTHMRLLIYDNNYPLTTRYLNIRANASGAYTSWDYEIKSGVTWGSGRTNGRIAYTNYNQYLDLWNNRGSLTNGSLNLVAANSDDLKIYDVDGREVASVTGGALQTANDKIQEVSCDAFDLESGVHLNYMLYLPVDLYTIENTDKSIKAFDVEIVNEDLGAQVVTNENKVTLCADDSCNLSSVLLDAAKNESYEITLYSSRKGDPGSRQWKGVGEGETISVMTDSGSLATCNMENTDLSIGSINGDKKATTYEITSEPTEHGEVSCGASTTVLAGDDVLFTITPNAGYKIKDVQVDGKSVGAVSTYMFKDVKENHTISAVFEPIEQTPMPSKNGDNGTMNTVSGKRANIIQASNFIKTYSKSQKFSIGAKAEGGARLSYQSSNKKVVQVSSNGMVIINGVGKTTITITAEDTDIYDAATKKITVTVKPKGTSVSKVKKAGKAFTVKWKKQTIQTTGYQIQYSTNSKFKKGNKTVTVKKNKATSKKINRLKAKKKYYVRVRTYKTVGKTKYYSSWSKTKAVKVR